MSCVRPDLIPQFLEIWNEDGLTAEPDDDFL